MHMTIAALVYATDEGEALERGTMVFERLVERGDSFDYFTTLDRMKKDEVVAEGGLVWKPAMNIHSKVGMKVLDGLWKCQMAEYELRIKNLRRVFKRSIKVLLEDCKDWQYNAICLGEYHGSSTWLYDGEGEGIKDKRHLDDVKKYWPSLQEHSPELKMMAKKTYIFIVPADVHY